MSVRSQQRGTQFGRPKQPTGVLSPKAWAEIMYKVGFPSSQVVAEGLGIISRESNFNTNPGGDGAHFGAWQEDSSFGTKEQRLHPVSATAAAYKRWKADGESFYPAWGRWQKEQGGVDGATLWTQYKSIAESASSGSGDGGGWFSGVPDPGDLLEVGGGVIDAATSAADFLTELGRTILDFRALGNLMAQATAWFIKLIAKAIWDYVIAPLVHWSERAVSFYWVNFFGTGTEKGSGFGYQLRNNAGAVTILFWSMGYSILWSDGTSLSPAPAHESLLGQGVKGIERTIARRNLVKPAKVKEKTPSKPEPKVSKVSIERQQTYSVARKRPITVHTEGRQHGGNQRRLNSRPVPRPTQSKQKQKIILPPGTQRQAGAVKKEAVSAKPRRSELGPRGTRNSRA